jgi:hypothetical protein
MSVTTHVQTTFTTENWMTTESVEKLAARCIVFSCPLWPPLACSNRTVWLHQKHRNSSLSSQLCVLPWRVSSCSGFPLSLPVVLTTVLVSVIWNSAVLLANIDVAVVQPSDFLSETSFQKQERCNSLCAFVAMMSKFDVSCKRKTL